jgi:hypothetical protein
MAAASVSVDKGISNHFTFVRTRIFLTTELRHLPVEDNSP